MKKSIIFAMIALSAGLSAQASQPTKVACQRQAVGGVEILPKNFNPQSADFGGAAPEYVFTHVSDGVYSLPGGDAYPSSGKLYYDATIQSDRIVLTSPAYYQVDQKHTIYLGPDRAFMAQSYGNWGSDDGGKSGYAVYSCTLQ